MAKCTPCLGANIKEVITELYPNLASKLSAIKTCPVDTEINFCAKGAKGERKKSAYQEFVSQCMKSKNIKGFGNAAPAMRECAAEWRKKNGK